MLLTLMMAVSVVMMFVMGTFKEKHLDDNYCTGTATPLRGYTSSRDGSVKQHLVTATFLSDSLFFMDVSRFRSRCFDHSF